MTAPRAILAALCLSGVVVQAFVTVVSSHPREDDPDGEKKITREYAKACQELAVGVSLCNEIDIDGKELEILMDHHHVPTNCNNKVAKGDFLRLHYKSFIAEGSKAGVAGTLIEEAMDFTRGSTVKVGTDLAPVKAWDMSLVGLCLGQKFSMTVPPEVGYRETFKAPDGIEGATLRFDMEIMIIMEPNKKTGKPLPPNLFKLMDADGSKTLSETEVHSHFSRIGQKLPSPTLFADQDKDKDGAISWEEFSGPKGGSKDEL